MLQRDSNATPLVVIASLFNIFKKKTSINILSEQTLSTQMHPVVEPVDVDAYRSKTLISFKLHVADKRSGDDKVSR